MSVTVPKLSTFRGPQAGNQILCCDRPIGKFELETSFEKATGDDAATLEDKFGFSSQKNRPDFQHPLRAGSPMRVPRACRRALMNSLLGTGFGDERFTQPVKSSRVIRNSIADRKSAS